MTALRPVGSVNQKRTTMTVSASQEQMRQNVFHHTLTVPLSFTKNMMGWPLYQYEPLAISFGLLPTSEFGQYLSPVQKKC